MAKAVKSEKTRTRTRTRRPKVANEEHEGSPTQPEDVPKEMNASLHTPNKPRKGKGVTQCQGGHHDPDECPLTNTITKVVAAAIKEKAIRPPLWRQGKKYSNADSWQKMPKKKMAKSPTTPPPKAKEKL